MTGLAADSGANERLNRSLSARRSNWFAQRELICSALAGLTALGLFFLSNAAVGKLFPPTSRLATNFSASELRRDLTSSQGQTIFLGDSVLWGFLIKPDETAVDLLKAQGCACRNLAFKHGGPVNYYALARVIRATGIRPKAVVIEVNRQNFSPKSISYRALLRPVAELSLPYLTGDDRRELYIPPETLRTALDRALDAISRLYAERVDIHVAVYGEDTKPFGPELLGQLFDLPRLDRSNVGFRYLLTTVQSLRGAGIPVLAFLTPQNHAEIDPFVDRDVYRANTAAIEEELRLRGAQVVNLDSALSRNDFLDEEHLTPGGQRRLAALLADRLAAIEASARLDRQKPL